MKSIEGSIVYRRSRTYGPYLSSGDRPLLPLALLGCGVHAGTTGF
jgi:hypothetical protein